MSISWTPGRALHQTETRPSPRRAIAKILLRTRKVGVSQVSCSAASGNERQKVWSLANGSSVMGNLRFRWSSIADSDPLYPVCLFNVAVKRTSVLSVRTLLVLLGH